MKEKLGETALNYLKMADSSVDRLDLTVQEILDYSRNARLDLQITEFDLSMVIEDIFNDLRFGTEREMSFSLHYEGQKVIRSDRYRISTLLKNIIGNSVKYRNRKINNSKVEVSVVRKEDKTEITVADNGIGIAEHNIEKIFDMFYRASSDVTGTGLGLYICKEIMSRLGGDIRVESVLGTGTTMLFLDIRMPEMTGFELLDKLLQAYPIEAIKKMRIFMLTSSLDENDNQKAADNPLIEGYLGKPLDIVELVKILS